MNTELKKYCMITLGFLASLLGSSKVYAQTTVSTDSLAHIRQDTTILDTREIDLQNKQQLEACLLYTSDAADEPSRV